jgi:hypothetical protein
VNQNKHENKTKYNKNKKDKKYKILLKLITLKNFKKCDK